MATCWYGGGWVPPTELLTVALELKGLNQGMVDRGAGVGSKVLEAVDVP